MQIINLYFTILHILHNNVYSEKMNIPDLPVFSVLEVQWVIFHWNKHQVSAEDNISDKYVSLV